MEKTLNDSFLEDIIANPSDNAPRLIYADWLDDNGQAARAEFIRVQIALNELAPADPTRQSLQVRSKELLDRHEREWSATIQGFVTGFTFRRGFVAEVTVSGEQMLEHERALLTCAPIESIHLDATSQHLISLVRLRVFQRVTRLEFRGHDLGDAGVQTLIRSPNLGQLEGLILHHCGLTSSSALLLTEMPFRRLTHLNLGANDLRDEGIATLGGCEDLTALEYLGIGGNELGSGAARTLAETQSLRSLTKLNMGANYLGDGDLTLLAGAAHLQSLRELDLRYNEFGHDGAMALANSPYLSNLDRLDVTENTIGPEATARLRERFGAAVIL